MSLEARDDSRYCDGGDEYRKTNHSNEKTDTERPTHSKHDEVGESEREREREVRKAPVRPCPKRYREETTESAGGVHQRTIFSPVPRKITGAPGDS